MATPPSSIDTSVVVAIVAAFASLASACIAWFQSVRVKHLEIETQEKLANLTTNTQLAIEKLKIYDTRLDKALTLASAESEPLEDILSEFWQKIQIIKDELLKLCEVEEHRIDDLETVTNEIRSIIRDFAKVYQQHGIEIPQFTKMQIHQCKNIMLDLENYLFTLPRKEAKKNASIRLEVEKLELYREQMTSCQELIAIQRSSNRADLLHQFLKMMRVEIL